MHLMEIFDFSRLFVDAALWMLIWLVQLIIYPSFHVVDLQHFKAWHNKYTGLITIFVAPLMFAQTGIYAWATMTDSSWLTKANLGLVIATWLATFILSVPCHDRLQRQGPDEDTIRRLVKTNWIRTATWNSILILDMIHFLDFGF